MNADHIGACIIFAAVGLFVLYHAVRALIAPTRIEATTAADEAERDFWDEDDWTDDMAAAETRYLATEHWLETGGNS